jgi:ABC-type polysaccharide/polyol phosphate export permease
VTSAQQSLVRSETGTGLYDSAHRPPPFIEELVALYRYRDLVVQLILRNVKARYKRSILGVAWTMINPLLTMLVLTLVFSALFRIPSRQYALYVLSGLLAWNFFAQTTIAAMGDLIWSGGLLGRIFLPKSAFAVSAVGTGLVNLALALVPYWIIAAALGAPIRPAILLLPLPVLCLALFALGLGLALSTAAVYFQDVMPTYEIVLTAWMYVTPVIYPIDLVPRAVQSLLRANPMFYLVSVFRSVLYDGQAPRPDHLALAFVLSLASLLVGWWVFTRRARDFAYHV